MNPIKTKYENAILHAPKDWNGECVSLSVFYDKENEYIQSWWEPTPEEIEALNNGGKVMLAVWGTGHPAVALGVNKDEDL